jgi:hypothetical protein
MRRRRLLLGAGLLGLVALAGLAAFVRFTAPTPGVTVENYRRLRIGMTAQQVEAILGEGPTSQQPTAARGRWQKYWKGKELTIYLLFERDGIVLRGNAGPADRDPFFGEVEVRESDSFIDRLHRWLGW